MGLNGWNVGGPISIRKRFLVSNEVRLSYGAEVWAYVLDKGVYHKHLSQVQRRGDFGVVSAYGTVSEQFVLAIAWGNSRRPSL